MTPDPTHLVTHKRKQAAPGKLFVEQLLIWNRHKNTRSMPWKGETDPYKIWLSEIILQQTRVSQGLKYYEVFVNAFPNVNQLAAAPAEKVFKLWEGLGYYSRCRNLMESARYISNELNGVFPSEHASILNLKGVGAYTAAAIASFAYNLPHAVVDGNVYRVLSRIENIDLPIDSQKGKIFFSKLAQQMIPNGTAGVYNQAIMDFGAVICKLVPLCNICFYHTHCKAYLKGKQDLLPFKEKKIKITKRWMTYFILINKNCILIHQRMGKDIWKDLFEFPNVETDQELSEVKKLQLLKMQYGFSKVNVICSQHKEQKLTHQVLFLNLIEVEVSEQLSINDYNWVHVSDLDQYAFPKTLQTFIQERLTVWEV